MNNPDKIIVHHDGVIRVGPSFDIINEYHKTRDFPVSSLGFYCGYHYFIEYDGTVVRARLDTETGAHTIGQNNSSVGIGMAGNFDVEWPTLQQEQALSKLLSEIANSYNIQPNPVYPHRHFAQKTCFGSRLGFHWAAKLLIAEERRRIDAAEQAIENGLQ